MMTLESLSMVAQHAQLEHAVPAHRTSYTFPNHQALHQDGDAPSWMSRGDWTLRLAGLDFALQVCSLANGSTVS